MTDNDKLKEECKAKVAQKYRLGKTLVTGHLAKYWEEYADLLHLARLEAITPEMIEKQFVIDYTSSPSHYKMQRVMMNNVEADAKREGAKWVLKRLKDNDLSK